MGSACIPREMFDEIAFQNLLKDISTGKNVTFFFNFNNMDTLKKLNEKVTKFVRFFE